MAKAYKCDKCGSFYEEGSTTKCRHNHKLGGRFLLNNFVIFTTIDYKIGSKSGDRRDTDYISSHFGYREEADLCDACKIEILTELIKETNPTKGL